MQTSDVISRVKDLAGTKDDEKAKLYIGAVLGELREHISPEGVKTLGELLPKELREMWDMGLLHQVVHAVTGVEHEPLSEFIGHVQNRARLADGDEAERITIAVFSSLKEQMTESEIETVAHHFPENLRKLWTEGSPVNVSYTSDVIGTAAVELFRHDDQILQEVEQLLELNDEVDESTINVHIEQGKVLLSGTVRSEEEREAAEQAVREALGVTEVRNELRTKGQ